MVSSPNMVWQPAGRPNCRKGDSPSELGSLCGDSAFLFRGIERLLGGSGTEPRELISATDSSALPSSVLSVIDFVFHLALQSAMPCESDKQYWQACTMEHFSRLQPLRLLYGKHMALPFFSR